MTNLVIAYEGVSVASGKMAEALRKTSGKDIKLFYSVPWHSLIMRPVKEDIGTGEYVDFVSHFGDDKAISVFAQYGGQDSYQCAEEYNPINFTENELRDITVYLNSEQWMTIDINNRFFLDGIGRVDCLRYIDMLAYFYESVFEKHQPSIIYDIDTSNIHRYILYVVSKRMNIKYMSIVHSRYENYVFTSMTLGEKAGEELRNKATKLFDGESLRSGKIALDKYRARKDILNDEEKREEKKRVDYSLKDLLKVVIGNVIYSFRELRIKKKEILRASNVDSGFRVAITPSVFKAYWYNLIVATRKYIRSLNKNVKFRKTTKYYYMPLSYTVEGASAAYSNGWQSDLILISCLRAWIPLDSEIITKEHRAMFGERTFRESKLLSSIPGINYIGAGVTDENVINPLQLIKSSLGVISLSGTSGLEAALLGKPLLLFGNPVYNQFIGHKVVTGMSDIRQYFQSPSKYIPSEDSTVKYISSLQICGVRVDYSGILNCGKNISTQLDEDFQKLAVMMSKDEMSMSNNYQPSNTLVF